MDSVSSTLLESDLTSTNSYPRQKLNNDVYLNMNTATPTRYRNMRDVDINSWDDEATMRLRYTFQPSGDLFDCLGRFRRPLGFRKLPTSSSVSKTTVRNLSKTFGVIWFVRDPCGIACVFITWLLVMYAEFVIDFIILAQSSSLVFCWTTGITYHIFIFLAIYSHYKAVTVDPGSIPLGTATQAMAKYIQEVCHDTYIVRCTKCLCIKPSRVHHCRICQRCVYKMDHHCPWVNNCVGERNQKYFILFTFYICLSSFLAIYMSVYFLIQCVSSDWEVCRISNAIKFVFGEMDSFYSTVLTLMLVGESFVFGVFTMVMCISQLCAISHDETGIENIKKEQPTWKQVDTKTNFEMVFGSKLSWRWLSPFGEPLLTTQFIPGIPDELPDKLPTWCAISQMENVHITELENGYIEV